MPADRTSLARPRAQDVSRRLAGTRGAPGRVERLLWKGALIVVAALSGAGPGQAGQSQARTTAVPVRDFLDSIGICSTFPDRGQPIDKTIEMVKYVGFRWVRGGIEGLSAQGPTTVQTYLDLHEKTGVRFSWGLVSGGTDLKRLIETARQLAAAGCLLAFEGNNEPNNWGVTYQGERGGRNLSWLPVAKLQRDLYNAVKSDPVLKDYPVWGPSECGAETDNVGLQFLTIPNGAGCLMPDGTRYADYANCHNYLSHPGWPGLHDNQTWVAADPTSACRVDGLYGNHGRTWARKYQGYSESELLTLPRVTTETGVTIEGPFTEHVQGLLYMSVYLAQFKRGWSYTSIYILRDRTDEGGNQTFGFYRPDYTPRPAATYLHNLTAILADDGAPRTPGGLAYSIPGQPATVHDLLLQKSDGRFLLVVWDERFTGGSDQVTVELGARFPSVTLYDPTVGTSPTGSLSDVSSVTLTLSDHPVIIEIATRTSGPVGARNGAATKRPARRRPKADALAAFDRALFARVRDELASGRAVGFFMASARQNAKVLAAEGDSSLRLLAGPQGAAVEMTRALEELSLADRKSLALAVLREGVPGDHRLAGFYLMASGEDEQAERELAKTAPAEAREVRAAFSE